MIALLLLQVALLGVRPVPDPLPMRGESRTYHGVAVKDLQWTKFSHVAVCGQVTLVKREQDGDVHLRISDGTMWIVAEIVPYRALPSPRLHQWVRIAGISRIDRAHTTKEYPAGWPEIHPAEAISVVGSCKT